MFARVSTHRFCSAKALVRNHCSVTIVYESLGTAAVILRFGIIYVWHLFAEWCCIGLEMMLELQNNNRILPK